MYYTIPCTNCTEVNDIHKKYCYQCGNPIPGSINVKRASIQAEKDQLLTRYKDAKDDLTMKSLVAEGDKLENEIINNGKAIVNTDLVFVFNWLITRKFSYISYRRQIITNTRPRSEFSNDINRCVADALLFGSTEDIIYAALTVDERGLSSYGPIGVVLKSMSIKERTSCLETNSFFFIDDLQKKGWRVNTPMPPGFMSTWHEKEKLGIAKLHKSLTKGISSAEIAKLILNSDGNRANDTFIELYIEGLIEPPMVEKLIIPASFIATASALEKSRIEEIQRSFNVSIV